MPVTDYCTVAGRVGAADNDAYCNDNSLEAHVSLLCLLLACLHAYGDIQGPGRVVDILTTAGHHCFTLRLPPLR